MHLSRGQVQWNNCFHISQEKFLESPEIIVQVGDIIITKDGTIGKVAYIDYLPGPASLNSHLFLVRPKVGIVNRRFAYHIFNSWIFNRYIEDHQTGSTLSGLSERHFLNFPFPLPTLSEQQRIAEILDTIDEKIEHTEQLIAKLKLQKSGILHDLFTLGFEEHGQLRNPIAHPEQFKDSMLGRIPKEWSIREFEELADIIDPQPNHRAPVEVAGGEPYIGVGDLRADGSINFESCRKVSREAVTKQQQRFRIEAGDIIFGKIGTIGFPQFLPQGIRYALNANTVLIKPKENPW
jgi:type I restriction enzyme S subunit